MPSRRALLVGAVGFTAAAGLADAVDIGPVTAPEPAPDTWPQDLYGPANTAGNPSVEVPAGASIDWRTAELPPSYATTVVVGPERIYLGGSGIVAFDRTDGTRQWRVEAPGHFLSFVDETLFGASPSVANGFDADTVGPVAIDVERGSPKWQADGLTRIYHIVASENALFVGDHGRLLAFDRQTGRRRWAVKHGYDAETYPMISDGTLFGGLERLVRFESRSLLDLVTFSGPSIRWETDYYDEMNPPTGINDRIVFGRNRHTVGDEHRPGLVAFDTTSGKQVWGTIEPRPEDDRLTVSSPAVVESDGFVGIRSGNDDDRRYAVASVDLGEGKVNWRRDVDQRVWTLAVGTETVVVGTAAPSESTASQKGAIQAFDRSEGSKRWRIPTESPIASVALVDGTVYASTVHGGILALR